MADPTEIFDFIARQGKRAVLPPSWSRVSCHDAFFNIEHALPSLEEKLRAAFSMEALTKSGVFVTGDQGQPVLLPRLTVGKTFVMRLQKKKADKPFDLLVDGQSLSRPTLGWRQVFADYGIQSLLDRAERQLFAVFDPADFAILWSLGLPAIPAYGLDQLGGKTIDQFFRQLGRSAPQKARKSSRDRCPEEDTAGDPISLVFPNWSLSSLVLADVPEVQQIRDHFLKLDEYLGLPVDEFSSWQPAVQSLERIKFCLEFGTQDNILAALVASIRSDENTFCKSRPAPEPLPDTYAEAQERWFAARSDNKNADRKKRAWDHLQQRLEEELVRPLLEQARTLKNPLDRNRLQHLANLQRMIQPLMLNLTARYHDAGREGGGKTLGLHFNEELRQVLAVTDRIRAITQELEPWRPKSIMPITMLPIPKAPKHSSKASDSPPKKSA